MMRQFFLAAALRCRHRPRPDGHPLQRGARSAEPDAWRLPVDPARRQAVEADAGHRFGRLPRSQGSGRHVLHGVGPRREFYLRRCQGCARPRAGSGLPAVDGIKEGAGRLYPRPDDVIAIFQVKLDPAAKTYSVAQTIPLKTPKGSPITGLTNPLTVATTEKPRDGNGQPLKQNINAIDAEGLVRLPDGRFFVAEENATGLVEVAADGTVLRRFVPAGTEKDFAAAEYPVSGSCRPSWPSAIPTAGSESLSMSEDGRFLYTMVQNPLDNPDAKAYGRAFNTRLYKLEIGKDTGGATTLTPVAEYVYRLDDFAAFAKLGATDAKKPSDLRISEMTALGHEHFLVDERTDQIARFFEIDLAGATNILGSKWDDVATSPTLEQAVDLAGTDIIPVKKTERLLASSLEGATPRFPGKIEGLSLTADGKLFMINDNDFGISGAETVITIVEDPHIGSR